jgi:hypothetical protein
MVEAWENAYRARFDKSPFGDDALGLFALGLQFGLDDLESIGTEIVTGGGDDKKCDLLYFDGEEGRCVVAQCYVSRKRRPAAPSSKASDLNTAVTWLLTTRIDTLPERLKANAQEIRRAITDDTLREIYIWYVHNLPESKNVRDEIAAVEHTASVAIKNILSAASTKIFARECGSDSFVRLYRASESPILVTDEIEIEVPTGF